MVGWYGDKPKKTYRPDIPGNGTGERWVWVDGEYVEYIGSQRTGRRMIIIQWNPAPLFKNQRLPEYKPRRIPAPIISMYSQPLYRSPVRPVVTCVRNRLPCPDRRAER